MSRRSPAEAAAHAELAEALPELWHKGLWLVLSTNIRLPGGDPAFLHVLIDVPAGVCLVIAIDDAPLGARVGSWLDAAVKDGDRPVRVFTDNERTIHLGTLASWGAARGVSTVCHPGASAPTSVSMVMQSLPDALNGLLMVNPTYKDADLALSHGLEDWRLRYNISLAGPPAARP
ncbi:hypothetical protein [Cupriavidus sp. CP313]